MEKNFGETQWMNLRVVQAADASALLGSLSDLTISDEEKRRLGREALAAIDAGDPALAPKDHGISIAVARIIDDRAKRNISTPVDTAAIADTNRTRAVRRTVPEGALHAPTWDTTVARPKNLEAALNASQTRLELIFNINHLPEPILVTIGEAVKHLARALEDAGIYFWERAEQIPEWVPQTITHKIVEILEAEKTI